MLSHSSNLTIHIQQILVDIAFSCHCYQQHFIAFCFRYLVTEGQIFSVYLVTLVAMVIMVFIQKSRDYSLDVNGRFLLYTFTVTLILTVAWVAYLWSDPVLRTKYPGIIYVPEPWAYYTLYLKQPWLPCSASIIEISIFSQASLVSNPPKLQSI